MKIGIIGMHGSGKSTLAELLSKAFNIMHLNSDVLAQTHRVKGEYEVSNLMKTMIGDSEHYILDGFPRIVKYADIPLDAVVYLKLPDGLIGVERLVNRGDEVEAIRERVSAYFKHIHPLVDHFKEKLININADYTPLEVFGKTVMQLKKRKIPEAEWYVKKLFKRRKKG